MSRLRAVLRRLDAWAAVVLGVLVTLGVIILVATPGPWHVVVRSAPQIRLAAPPPSDVAVFVNGTSSPGGCTGIVWLHLRYDSPALACMVVPAELQGGLAGAGYQSLARIVRDAGPAAGAQALGEALGVKMKSWVYLDRSALRTAFPGVFEDAGTLPMRARLRAMERAWSGRGAARGRFVLQTGSLRGAINGSSWVDLNLVAFVNYVLAAPSVDTDLRLQGASAIATVLKTAPPDQILVGAVPVVELRCGRYRRWMPARLPLLALRQAFAFDASVPVLRPVVSQERLPSRVLVLASPAPAALLRAYGEGLERALRDSAGRRVAVDVVPVATAVAALPVVEGLAERPPLAVVVAIGRQRPAAPEGIEQGLRILLDALTAAGQPALVSEVPVGDDGVWAGVNKAIDAAAAASGTPLSPVAPLLQGTGESGVPLAAPVYSRWAALNAQALVRAVQPVYFAPRLLSTRSGFDYYQRTKTSVAVAGPDPARVVRQASSVANLGFAVAEGQSKEMPDAGYRTLYYQPTALRPALILADELHVPEVAVTASPPPPSSDLALILP